MKYEKIVKPSGQRGCGSQWSHDEMELEDKRSSEKRRSELWDQNGAAGPSGPGYQLPHASAVCAVMRLTAHAVDLLIFVQNQEMPKPDSNALPLALELRDIPLYQGAMKET